MSSPERFRFVSRRVLVSTAASLAALLRPSLVRAADAAPDAWPATAVRYINLFPPGGSTDLLSRIYCQALSGLSGRQFVVEARSGAGGTIGQAAIAQAPPDGYTIGLGSVASLAIAPSLLPALPYNPARDFTYVAGIWKLPNILLVNNSFPASTVEELIAEVRRNPGRYSYGSSGTGTSPHLSMEMLKQRAELNILHVPYRGSGPAMVDLLGGRVQMMFDNIASPLPAVREGRVRALAVTSLVTSPAAPSIPPLAGILPGFEVTSWGCVVGPAGLPRIVAERLAALTRRALNDPELVANFAELGATPWHVQGPALLSFREQQERLFANLIRRSGVSADG